MKKEDIDLLRTKLADSIKEAKNLGMTIVPGGSYSTIYTKDNLPPYPVGLFGALSIVNGSEARSKLGLTYKQTEAIECGFNGDSIRGKKNKAHKELYMLGNDLRKLVYDKPKIDDWAEVSEGLSKYITDEAQYIGKAPTYTMTYTIDAQPIKMLSLSLDVGDSFLAKKKIA